MIPRILCVAALFATTSATAAEYAMRAGSLTFVGTQQGERFEGHFTRFTPEIRFDPTDLAGSKIEATIDLDSADTRNVERDEALRGADFFAVSEYPTARFVTTSLRAVDDSQYEADATLTIRGRTVPLKFPFQFETNGEAARLHSKVTLNRLDFAIGTGDWADESLIGHEVEVIVDLSLVKR